MTLFDVKFDQKTITYLLQKGKTAKERIPDSSLEEEARPIATFKGGKFTVGDYLGLLEELKPKIRPVADDSIQVMNFIRDVLRRVYLSNLAIQYFKIEDDPEVASKLREKRFEMMTDELVRREVAEKVDVSQEEVDTHYQTHKDRYLTLLPAQAHVMAIAVKTEGEARKLRRTIKGSSDLLRLFERYKGQERGWPTAADFHLHPFETRQYGDLATQAFQVPTGKILGPIHVPRYGYVIYEVVEREDQGDPRSAHLVKAKQAARMELRNEKGRKLYNQFILSLRKKYADQTFIFDDHLKLVKSPSDTTKTEAIDTTRKG